MAAFSRSSLSSKGLLITLCSAQGQLNATSCGWTELLLSDFIPLVEVINAQRNAGI